MCESGRSGGFFFGVAFYVKQLDQFKPEKLLGRENSPAVQCMAVTKAKVGEELRRRTMR